LFLIKTSKGVERIMEKNRKIIVFVACSLLIVSALPMLGNQSLALHDSQQKSKTSSSIKPLREGENVTWELKASMPTSRRDLAACTIDMKIYAIGGILSTGFNDVSNALEEYNSTTDNWTIKSPMPTARCLLGASAVDGMLFAIGGCYFTGGGHIDPVYLNVNEMYNPENGSWVSRCPLPISMCNFGTAVFSGKIYVFGGQNLYGGEDLDTVFSYDPDNDSWTELPSMPFQWAGMSVVALYNQMYLSGGSFSKMTQAYDPINRTWSAKANLSGERIDAGTVVVKGKIYAIGNSQFVEEYDPALDTWTEYCNDPDPSCHFGIVAIEDTIYLIGGQLGPVQRAVGYNPSAKELFYTNYQLYKCVNPDTCVVNNELYMNVNSKNCLEVYNPSHDIWYYTPPRPKTNETGICPFDDKIYCFGGNQVQVYNPAQSIWNLRQPMPSQRHNPYALKVCDRICVVGGGQNTLDVYDPLNDSWPITSNMPWSYYEGFQATVWNDRVYIIGWYDGSYSFVQEFNITTGEWTLKNQSRVIPIHSICTFGDRIYFAGENDASFAFTAYDILNDTFSQMSSLYIGHGGSWEYAKNMVFANNDLYFFTNNSIYQYGLASDIWVQQVVNFLGTRGVDGRSAEVMGDWIYLVGGSSGSVPPKGQDNASTNLVTAFHPIFSPPPILQINITGGIGVNLKITNYGIINVTGVPYWIHVEGGILGLINKTMNGTIDVHSGETISVATLKLFGLGHITITVKVANEVKIVEGTQFFIFSIIK
jgi:N-acetylneuraminic acid mutarotase